MVLSLYALRHVNADELLSLVRPELHAHERASNLIYSELLARSSGGDPNQSKGQYGQRIIARLSSETPYSGTEEGSIFPKDSNPPPQFWLTIWSSYESLLDSTRTIKLDLVLSCLRNPLGGQPLFFFFNGNPENIPNEFLSPRMQLLCKKLASVLLSPRRVFSCFGPRELSIAFADYWSRLTQNLVYPHPFYHATATFCTRATIQEPIVLPPGHIIQLAGEDYVEATAELCKEFAATSTYFLRNNQQALEEATYHIRRQQLWMYIADDEVTAILVLSRKTPNVVAITKVFTSENERNKGYAKSLVSHVCRFALHQLRVQQVILFVSHDNIAEHVYGGVGFVGVGRRSTSYPAEADLLEDWMELGFVDSDRGYW